MTGLELALIAVLSRPVAHPESATLSHSPVACASYDKRDGIVPQSVAGFICVAVTGTFLGVPVAAQVEGAFFRKRNGRVLCQVSGPVDLIQHRGYVTGCGLTHVVEF